MKKLLRSTFGTLVVATFLAITPPMYARGGHGGRGHGHSISHATRGHAGFGVRGGRGQRFVGHARANTRFAGRAFRATRGGWGRGWGGSYWYPYSGYSRFGYYGSGYGYPYYGSYGYPSRWYYYPYYGYYPYRYGYWPYGGLNFGVTFY
jgi:hypothetical protein